MSDLQETRSLKQRWPNLSINWILLFFIGLLALLSFQVAVGQQDTSVSAKIVSRQYSSGFLPIVGSYVEYELRLDNTGNYPTGNQLLHVSFVSDGKSRFATYAVSTLDPGESKTLRIGPFKIEHEGRHEIFAETDDISVQYIRDSFIAYTQEVVYAILIAALLIAAGAGIISISIYKRRMSV